MRFTLLLLDFNEAFQPILLFQVCEIEKHLKGYLLLHISGWIADHVSFQNW